MSQERQRLAAQVAAAVQARLGNSDPSVAQLIESEVTGALTENRTHELLTSAVRDTGGVTPERVVVTATGPNRPGIVASLAGVIDEFQGDIQDISQTLVAGYFTMIFVVDISGTTRQGTTFVTLRKRLQEVAADLGIHVVALHDDILSAMHEV